jgi:pSer/pThr/pTyr-binding forkhead associated (FHA) protein
MEAREILIMALQLGRERFMQQFPDFLLVGDSAIEESPWSQMQQTAVARPTAVSLPAQVVCAIPRGRAARLSVGRNTDSDLQIIDETVSKTHAYLQPAGDQPGWVLIDAGSRNGTWVGEQRLPPNGQPVPLHTGMRLRFGEVALTVVDSGSFWDRLHP